MKKRKGNKKINPTGNSAFEVFIKVLAPAGYLNR
jgi:hypothetical protein